jgi:prepilin signal peptidase PulO-like enzyme (type II secretory pathway)
MTSLLILKGIFFLVGGYVSFMDFRYGKIPNRAICLFGLLLILWIRKNGFWQEHLICGALSLGLIASIFYGLKAYKKKVPLGGGDLKLFPVVGAFNTLDSFPIFLILSGVFAGLTALVLRKEKFPLGPALVAGSMTVLLFLK